MASQRRKNRAGTLSARAVLGLAAGLCLFSAALYLAAAYLDSLPPTPQPLSECEVARERLFWMERDGRAEEVARAYEDFLAEYPDDERGLRNAVTYFRKHQKPERALSYIGRLAELNPEDAEPYLVYGEVAGEADDARTALKAYNVTTGQIIYCLY